MTTAEKALKWVTDHTDYISPRYFNVICDALQRAAECEEALESLQEECEGLEKAFFAAKDKAQGLMKALEKIKNIHTSDCAKYVRTADDIACEALAAFKADCERPAVHDHAAERLAEVMKAIIDYEDATRPAFTSDSFVFRIAKQALADYEESRK